MERVGVSKSPQWIDYNELEKALRDDLDPKARRATAVLKPLKLIIDNWPAGKTEDFEFPVHPQRPELGTRTIPFAEELWIEADDFMENPPADYFRLAPGQAVRLRYAYVIRCTMVEKDFDGEVTAVHAEYLPETRSGSPGQNSVKTRAAIHWLPVHASLPAEVRLYERLFTDPHPDAGGKDFLTLLNPDSKRVLNAFVEASLAKAQPDEKFQFERNGYFVADRKDYSTAQLVFNLAVTLKDSWGGK